MHLFSITDKPIEAQMLIESVQSDKAGAIAVFVGTVRNQTQGKKVVRLEFEAYEVMALKQMEVIVETAKQKFPIEKAAITHRVGSLGIGEIAVVIAVSTPHRAESFKACEFLIDTLKQVVPIWKKEIFEDGEVWVSAHA